MKRITLSLPDELADRIARESERRRVSVSEFVRMLLAKEFGDDNQPRRVSFSGIGSSGRSWSAANLDEELDRTWADDIRRGWER